MKRILLLLTVVVFASCSSDDDAGDIYTSEFEEINATLPQGEWNISTFIDGEEDKTSTFESFIFIFDADGTVEGKTDLFTESGTWAYDNTSSASEKLVLLFGEINPFNEINDDWDIVSLNNSKVELSDDDGNGNIKLLSFTKI